MNSKVWKVLIWIFSILIIAAIALAFYFYLVNDQRAKEEIAKENKDWQTYSSTAYGYQIQFPQKWFLVTEGYEPIFEKSLVFSNHQEFDTELVHTNLGLAVLDDLSEVDTLREIPYVETTAKVADIEAIQMVNWDDPNQMVMATYFEKEDKVFRLSLGPVQLEKQSEMQNIYDKFLKSFKFIDIGLKSFPEVAHAASYVLDQQYAPSTILFEEDISSTNLLVGQTFKPTYNNVAKVEVELTAPGSDKIHMYLTDSGNNVLAHYSKTGSMGWNTYTFSSSVTVSPNAEYRIFLMKDTTAIGLPKWRAGQQPEDHGNTYTRGYAIMGGFAEQDIDFHFKEYALVEESKPQQQTPGKKTPAEKEQAAEEAEEEKIKCELDAPTNLDFDLWIVGITKTYIDLEWDEIDDECLGGYKLYYGSETGQYTKIINAGKETKVRIKNLNPTRTYYFAVRAYDIYGKQSSASNEVQGKLFLESLWKWFWIFIPLLILLILSIILFFGAKKREAKKSEQKPV